MKHNAIAALLLTAASLLVLGCSKEKGYDGPSTLPKEKVSRVYRSSHTVTEQYSAFTDTWKTLSDQTNEREPRFEFIWEGERLASLNADDVQYTFIYDEFGRVSKIGSNRMKGRNYEFTYNEDGLMSHSYSYGHNENGDIDVRKNIDYIWADGKLQKANEEMWGSLGTEERVTTAEHNWTWGGENVISTVRNSIGTDGSTSVTNYSYEYTDIENPFQGFVLFQEPSMGIYWEVEGLEGLNRNLLSKVMSDKAEYTFENTVANGRIASIKVIQVATTSTPIMTLRITSEQLYEFEYAN